MATKKKTTTRNRAAVRRPTKPAQTWQMEVSAEELTFLRDLFGVLLPSPEDDEGHLPVCQALAQATKRDLVENGLWDKLVDLCGSAGVAIGDKKGVPDYAVIPVSIPQLGIVSVDRKEDGEG